MNHLRIILIVLLLIPMGLYSKNNKMIYFFSFESAVDSCMNYLSKDIVNFDINNIRLMSRFPDNICIRNVWLSYFPRIVKYDIPEDLRAVIISPQIRSNILTIYLSFHKFRNDSINYIGPSIYNNQSHFLIEPLDTILLEDEIDIAELSKEENILNKMINYSLYKYIKQFNISNPKIYIDSFFYNTEFSDEILQFNPRFISFDDMINGHNTNDRIIVLYMYFFHNSISTKLMTTTVSKFINQRPDYENELNFEFNFSFKENKWLQYDVEEHIYRDFITEFESILD